MKAAIKNKSALTTHEGLEPGEDAEDTPVANVIVRGLLDACREMIAEAVEAAHKTPATIPVDELKAVVEPASQTSDNSQATSSPVEVIHPEVTLGSDQEEEKGRKDAFYRQEPDLPEEPELEPALKLGSDPVPEQPKDLEPEPHLEPEKQEPEDDRAVPVTGKKGKKVKKVKKSNAAEVEHELVAECEPAPEPGLEPAAETPMDLAPETYCEPTREEHEFWPTVVAGTKGKKDKKKRGKKLDLNAMKEDAEPEPVAEASVPDTVDEWAAPVKKKKKKKKAVSIGSWADLVEEPRDIVEAKEAAVTIVTEVEIERDPWSFWGVTRSPTARQSLS